MDMKTCLNRDSNPHRSKSERSDPVEEHVAMVTQQTNQRASSSFLRLTSSPSEETLG